MTWPPEISRVWGSLPPEWMWAADSWQSQHEAAFFFEFERLNAPDHAPQRKLDPCGGAVADAQPYHLGRTAELRASLGEIGILRNNRQPVLERVIPDRLIGGATQAALASSL